MPPSNRILYLRLLSYVKPYWKVFALAILGMIGTAATEPVFPAIMKYLLDSGFRAADPRQVWIIPLGIVTLFLVRGIFSFCTGYLMTWISTRLVTDLRRQMFAKVLTFPIQSFHEESAGRLVSRFMYDVGNVNEAVTTVLVVAVRESLTAIALFAYLIYLDWKLTFITLLIAPVIALIVRGFGRRMRNASRMTGEALRNMSHTIEESANANKVIKVFGGQEKLRSRFAAFSEQLRRSMMKESVPSSAITPITHLAASVAVAIIIFLALSQTTGKAGESAGGFISFITALLMVISPLKQLTTLNTTLQRGFSSCESIFTLLDSQGEDDRGTVVIGRAQGNIEFKNVGFVYPGVERQALDNISFRAEMGQTIALVGGSGGGKTTIAALIPRFYRATSGNISIDGVPIDEITLDSLRRNISLVSQDVVLFHDTVAANIAFGSLENVTRDDVIAAAKAAHAWDFIQQLPEGLETSVGEGGASLSGGQRQRIAIARALLKNAPILILDEATAALDNESERHVQEALSELMQNCTTIVVAHRLSTIEKADRIMVLDQGKIVETGSHAELMARGGYYANLNRIQA